MTDERDIGCEALADLLVHRATAPAASTRLIVALAGPPGSGKSTSAATINEMLNASGHVRSAVFQMDGYHYDDAVLTERGLRPRKGAPETFDVAGFHHMLQRLKSNEEREIAVPVFDRALELSRAGARLISQDVNILIVEGNYILLQQEPWSRLAALFDVTVNIRTSEKILRERLAARWATYGIPALGITEKVEANDLPNGLLVLANSSRSDFVLTT